MQPTQPLDHPRGYDLLCEYLVNPPTTAAGVTLAQEPSGAIVVTWQGAARYRAHPDGAFALLEPVHGPDGARFLTGWLPLGIWASADDDGEPVLRWQDPDGCEHVSGLVRGLVVRAAGQVQP